MPVCTRSKVLPMDTWEDAVDNDDGPLGRQVWRIIIR